MCVEVIMACIMSTCCFHNASLGLFMLLPGLFRQISCATFISLMPEGDLGVNPKIKGKHCMHIAYLIWKADKHIVHHS